MSTILLPPEDNPSTSIWCADSAEVVLSNIVVSAAAATNAPYNSIACVGDTISASLQWFTLASTNASQTCHTYNGSYYTNWCDDPVYTAGASPYDVTNDYWNEWLNDDGWGYTNNNGNGTSFSFTNATIGWVGFGNISALMTTNAPGCGFWAGWADWASSDLTYAFVAVDSISPNSGVWVTNVPCDTYVVQYCPSNYVTVTAYPDPSMDDGFLPTGWNVNGGITATNTDGSPSRTVHLVDTGAVGPITVTATSGCSTQTVKIIVYQAKVELDAQKGNHSAHLFDFGHAWWNLTIQPSDVYPFLQGTDPILGDSVDLSSNEGPQGMGGFYDESHLNGPGQVIFENPQPDQQASAQAGYPIYHTNTGSYFWCVSFNSYKSALQYVYNLNVFCQTPGYNVEYRVASDNCTTEAEAVGNTAGVPNVPPTIYPGYLSKWLNGNPVVFTGNPITYQLLQPPACSCSP